MHFRAYRIESMIVFAIHATFTASSELMLSINSLFGLPSMKLFSFGSSNILSNSKQASEYRCPEETDKSNLQLLNQISTIG